jgi:hypothetical protein
VIPQSSSPVHTMPLCFGKFFFLLINTSQVDEGLVRNRSPNNMKHLDRL